MSSPGYHHGDLKSALLAAAARTLESTGYESLSLRGLAAEAGVSTAAPYRHFANRDDLLQTLVANGMLELERSYRQAIMDGDSPIGRLRGICEAYLDLALSRPQLFRLMFVSEVVMDGEFRLRISQPCYDLFEGAIAAAFPALAAPGIQTHAAFCWATIHGLALLRLHGRLRRFATPPADEDAVIQAALDRLFAYRPEIAISP